MYNIMTPGPTKVRENVLKARGIPATNPDLDAEFYDYYKDTCDMAAKFINSSGNVYILSGEGILGLEAACASLTEPGDRALVIDNGIYGRGFADFVSMYGGEPVLYTTDYEMPIDTAKLKEYLKKDHSFKYATVVHCDTPSGMLNDVMSICRLLKEYGILTVVDTVSASFGVPLDVDGGKIDIALMGSQKALSAPPGLTLVAVSADALNAMEQRKTPIASFYCNLLTFKNYYENKWFPYTMPINDIMGLNAALSNVINDKDVLKRHRMIGESVRSAVQKAGLLLYGRGGYSDTVTVIRVPEGVKCSDILERMKEKHGIMIAGSFDVLEGKVIRIGHMGENANVKDTAVTLGALDETFEYFNVKLQGSLKEAFLEEVNKRQA